jgi:hypothetical protein
LHSIYHGRIKDKDSFDGRLMQENRIERYWMHGKMRWILLLSNSNSDNNNNNNNSSSSSSSSIVDVN